jgi:hypothetical protein
MAAAASLAGSRHQSAALRLTGIDQLSRMAGNMDIRDAERCQCIKDRVDDGLRGTACRCVWCMNYHLVQGGLLGGGQPMA